MLVLRPHKSFKEDMDRDKRGGGFSKDDFEVLLWFIKKHDT
ncbi:MAG: hypothetical protein ACLFQJ_05635 [Campylobacterales bacterium]